MRREALRTISLNAMSRCLKEKTLKVALRISLYVGCPTFHVQFRYAHDPAFAVAAICQHVS